MGSQAQGLAAPIGEQALCPTDCEIRLAACNSVQPIPTAVIAPTREWARCSRRNKVRYRRRTCQNPRVPTLWIFGYGSLLFRPGFPHEERRAATVSGWMRRLDQGSPDHRGTPERLGRVATLVPMPGGSVGGAVYRVPDEHAEHVLSSLDHREKGGYDRLTLSAAPHGGGPPLTAITWIAAPGNPYHLGPAPLPAMVEQIRGAVGPSGANIEYVLRLAEALTELGVADPHVDEVAQALRAPSLARADAWPKPR